MEKVIDKQWLIEYNTKRKKEAVYPHSPDCKVAIGKCQNMNKINKL